MCLDLSFLSFHWNPLKFDLYGVQILIKTNKNFYAILSNSGAFLRSECSSIVNVDETSKPCDNISSIKALMITSVKRRVESLPIVFT